MGTAFCGVRAGPSSRRGLGGGVLSGGSGSSRAVRGCCRQREAALGAGGVFPDRAGVLHIRGRRPHGPIPGFPRDSGVLPSVPVFSVRAPMCRGDRSAHGRASTALSAGAFPHDSTNPPPAGPARMCNTARPGPTPHIQVWPRSPRTHSWHRLRPHAAPSSPRRSPAPEPHPDEKDSFCGRFAGLRPVVLRERAGFQSNAQMGGARSTGNLRVRGK